MVATISAGQPPRDDARDEGRQELVQIQLQMQVGVGNQLSAQSHQGTAVLHPADVVVDLPRDKPNEEGNQLLDAGVLPDGREGRLDLRRVAPLHRQGDAGEVQAKLFGQETGQELPDRNSAGTSTGGGAGSGRSTPAARGVDLVAVPGGSSRHGLEVLVVLDAVDGQVPLLVGADGPDADRGDGGSSSSAPRRHDGPRRPVVRLHHGADRGRILRDVRLGPVDGQPVRPQPDLRRRAERHLGLEVLVQVDHVLPPLSAAVTIAIGVVVPGDGGDRRPADLPRVGQVQLLAAPMRQGQVDVVGMQEAAALRPGTSTTAGDGAQRTRRRRHAGPSGEGGRRRRVGIDPLGEERTTAAGGAGASAGGGWTDGGPKPRPAGVALNRRRLPDEGRQVVLDEVAKRGPGGGLHLRRANIPRVPVVGIQHDTGRCVSVPFRSGEVLAKLQSVISLSGCAQFAIRVFRDFIVVTVCK